MADMSFSIACKGLKIAQIAQINELFQLLHLVHIIYGHGFCELSRMLMRTNVNNSPITPFHPTSYPPTLLPLPHTTIPCRLSISLPTTPPLYLPKIKNQARDKCYT